MGSKPFDLPQLLAGPGGQVGWLCGRPSGPMAAPWGRGEASAWFATDFKTFTPAGACVSKWPGGLLGGAFPHAHSQCRDVAVLVVGALLRDEGRPLAPAWFRSPVASGRCLHGGPVAFWAVVGHGQSFGTKLAFKAQRQPGLVGVVQPGGGPLPLLTPGRVSRPRPMAQPLQTGWVDNLGGQAMGPSKPTGAILGSDCWCCGLQVRSHGQARLEGAALSPAVVPCDLRFFKRRLSNTAQRHRRSWFLGSGETPRALRPAWGHP